MTTQRPLIGLVLVTGLVLAVAAASLLRGDRPDVVVAAERAALPAEAPELAQLVLPGAPPALEPRPEPVPASAQAAPSVAEPELALPAPSAPPEAAEPAAPASSGGVLSGTVVDGASGAPCEAEIWLSIPGAPSTNLVLQAPGGAFEQRLETPGHYALIARCAGKVGVLRDVPLVAGMRTENLLVTLREAARVRVEGVVQADGEEASMPWTCTLYQGDALVGVVVGASQAELAVPPGTLTARLLVPGTGERQQRTLNAVAGELAVIRFD